VTKGNGKAKKTSGETSGEVVGYGGNNNLTAGNPGNKGNKGGLGAPPSAIREYCRGSFAQRVPILEAIADGEVMERMLLEGTDKELEVMKSAKVVDRIKAIDVLAKYGGVDKIALTAAELPEDVLTPERKLEIWESLQRINRVSQLEKLLTDVVKKQVAG